MSSLILRRGWFGMVTPSEPELLNMLRLLYGPNWFRIPKRKWEDLWRLRRGQLNAALGLRDFKGPKHQRGIIAATAAYQQAPAPSVPTLTDITHADSSVAPTPSRQQYAYDSDGGMRHHLNATTQASIVYTDLSTQTDDTNNHTSEWWPDQPDTNEGLNWDIRWLNFVNAGPELLTASHLFADNVGVNRTDGTWYLLDTVSNDHGDASHNGGIGCNRSNGTTKTPDTGLSTMTVDVEIRTTGSGSAVASHSYDLDVEGT